MQVNREFNEYILVGSKNRFLIKTCPILASKTIGGNTKDILMKSFEADPYPGKREKLQLAKSLNTSQKTIENWFGNMRARRSKEGILKKSE